MVEVPGHAGAFEEEPFAARPIRAGRHRGIGNRIDEQLEGRAHRVASSLACDHSSEGAAGAVSPHGEPKRVDTEIARERDHRAKAGQRIIDRCREWVLGGEAVVDRDHHAARRLSEGATRSVVRIERADDPAASVEKHESTDDVETRLRPIEAGAQRRAVRVENHIGHRRERASHRSEE